MGLITKEEKSKDDNCMTVQTSGLLTPNAIASYKGYQLVSCVPITDQHTRSIWLQEHHVPVNYCYYFIKI